MGASIFTAVQQRKLDDTKQTQGGLLLLQDGNPIWQCDTLELPWRKNDPVTSCYPPNTYYPPTTREHTAYQVLRRSSRDFGWHFHVLVPNRAVRLFHAGNYAASKNPSTRVADTKGCCLLGFGYRDLDGDRNVEIINSGKAMRELLDLVPGGFQLVVHAPPSLLA